MQLSATSWCVDTPRWQNVKPAWQNYRRAGGNLGCGDYERKGYCRGGNVVPGAEWSLGAEFNSPELHCCACGKKAEFVRHQGVSCAALSGRPPITYSDRSCATRCAASPSCACFLTTANGSCQVFHRGHAGLRVARHGTVSWTRVGRMETSSQQSPASCLCDFGLCTARDLATFMMRLPTSVRHRSSPIHEYLQSVYRVSEVPLPFRLDKLNAFYPLLLPARPCSSIVRPGIAASPRANRASHRCAAQCDEWLARPLPSEGAITRFLRNRSYIRIIDNSTDDGTGRMYPFHQVVVLQPSPARRKLPKQKWVEVTRFADTHSSRVEGMDGYGCWFYPARGTGVWVHTGSTMVWPTWGSAWQTVKETIGERVHDDARFAGVAASRGHDSFQIIRSHGRVWGWEELNETAPSHELVIARPACMHGVGRLHGCVPVELRTGLNASRPCGCDVERHDLVQCVDTPRFV